MLLAANYHFIGSFDSVFSNLNGLSAETFIARVLWLKHRFSLAGPAEIRTALGGEAAPPDKAAIPAFGGGLKYPGDVAASRMRELNFPAPMHGSAKPFEQREAILDPDLAERADRSLSCQDGNRTIRG